MKKIGDYLKSEREQKGLSLEELSQRTKIHIQKLRLIEEGNIEELPAKVFIVGLIKSYAKELKVESSKIDELCSEAFETHQMDIPTPNVEAANSDEDIQDNQNVGWFQIPRPLAVLISSFFIVFLVFIIFLVVQKMNSYSQEELLPEVVLNKDTTDFVKENDISIGQNSPPPKVEKIESPQPEVKQTEQKIADNPNKPETTKAPATLRNKPPNMEEDDPNEMGAYVDNKLVIIVLEEVRAEIIWSDGYVQRMTLSKGDKKTLIFSSEITLRVSKGSSVDIRFNQKRQNTIKQENPIELKFP